MAEVNSNGTFQKTVDALMKDMDGFISSSTVIGEPVNIEGAIILPLVDVTFGMAAGAFIAEKKKNSGGGVGAKISPSAVLVIKDDVVKMVSVKSQDGIMKLIDMIPDFVNKFMKKIDEKRDPEGFAAKEEAREAAAEDIKEKLNIEE
ncbi:MAG: GerW family sporulation protein [Clostridiales bacterium]|nr:GerW family sporulation protein [Clostridiales bacterium]